jgi:hypothetical protein
MIKQSSELLKDDIEHLSDKIDWMISDAEQTLSNGKWKQQLKKSHTN